MNAPGRYEKHRFASLDQRVVDRLERQVVRRLLIATGVRKILDVPSGYGRFSAELGSHAKLLVSADCSLPAVLRCRTRPGGAKSFFVVADARELPFRDESFDLVFCFRLLHHFSSEDARGIVRELGRASRRWVLLSCYVETPLHRLLRKLQRRRSGIYFWEPRELHSLLEQAGLQVRRIVRLLPFLHGQSIGLLQKGRSA